MVAKKYKLCGNCTEFPCDNSGGHLRGDPACSDFEAKSKDDLRVYKAPGEDRSDISNYFTAKGRFVPGLMGADLVSHNAYMTYTDTFELLPFIDGVFTVDRGGVYTQSKIQESLGVTYSTTTRKNEVLNYIKHATLCERDTINHEMNYLNLKNGMYDILNDRLLPHDPKYKSTIQLNVTYDPDAECPNICRFMGQVAALDDVLLLAQYIGYGMTGDISQQRSVLIHGRQRNGKSTFSDIITEMVGGSHITRKSLQQLNTDRFAVGQLNGKLFNIHPDLSQEKIYDTSEFKTTTTDRYLNGEEKYIPAFVFKNTCHHIFSANQIPDITDKNEDAYFRRWIMVEFPYTFEGDTEVKNIISTLTTETEISGFFNMCMAGLRALIEHGEFCKIETVEEIKHRYLLQSNPVYAYMDQCTRDSKWDLVKSDLYEDYVVWCGESNRDPLKQHVFGRALGKLDYETSREPNGQRRHTYCNLALVHRPSNSEVARTDENKLPAVETWGTRPNNPSNYTYCYKILYNTDKSVNIIEFVPVCQDSQDGLHKPSSDGIDNISRKPKSQEFARTDVPLSRTDLNGEIPKETQQERFDKLGLGVKQFELFNKCVIDKHNYKNCASDFIKLNPNQSYDQVLEDLRYGWSITDPVDNMSMYGDLVSVKVLHDIPEIVHPSGDIAPAKLGDVLEINTTTAKALIKRKLVTEVV